MSFSLCASYCTLSEQMKQIVIQPQAVGFCCFHQRIDDCIRLRNGGYVCHSRGHRRCDFPRQARGYGGHSPCVYITRKTITLPQGTPLCLRQCEIYTGWMHVGIAFPSKSRSRWFIRICSSKESKVKLLLPSSVVITYFSSKKISLGVFCAYG